MAQASDIRPHMEVRGSDGQHLGTVDHVDGDRIKLTRSGSADGQHHYVPMSAVARVDAHVHLNKTAAALGLGLGTAAGVAGASVATGAEGHSDPFPPVKNRAVDGATPRGNFWLPWIVGVVGVILLLLLLKSCFTNHDRPAGPTTTAASDRPATAPLPVEAVALPNGQSVNLEPNTLNYELQRYLASDEATPRTFQFDKLNFDTGSATIRPEDQSTVDALGQVLAAYPKAKVRITGYTDARGTAPTNDQLGQQRADALVAALGAKGVDRNRVEAASGGETNPTDTNATAQGRFDNRRTELTVTAK